MEQEQWQQQALRLGVDEAGLCYWWLWHAWGRVLQAQSTAGSSPAEQMQHAPQRRGPLPLWQLALLEVCSLAGEVIKRCTSWLLLAVAMAAWYGCGPFYCCLLLFGACNAQYCVSKRRACCWRPKDDVSCAAAACCPLAGVAADVLASANATTLDILMGVLRHYKGAAQPALQDIELLLTAQMEAPEPSSPDLSSRQERLIQESRIRAVWGKALFRAAIEALQPDLLAWALQDCIMEQLWGGDADETQPGSGLTLSSETDSAALLEALKELTWTDRCSPVSCDSSQTAQQQRADLLELQQHQQQLLGVSAVAAAGPASAAAVGGLPAFAAAAAELAMPLLRLSPNRPDLLSDWLRTGLTAACTAADLARAKAVLLAVDAAPEVPPGARVLRQEALR